MDLKACESPWISKRDQWNPRNLKHDLSSTTCQVPHHTTNTRSEQPEKLGPCHSSQLSWRPPLAGRACSFKSTKASMASHRSKQRTRSKRRRQATHHGGPGPTRRRSRRATWRGFVCALTMVPVFVRFHLVSPPRHQTLRFDNPHGVGFRMFESKRSTDPVSGTKSGSMTSMPTPGL